LLLSEITEVAQPATEEHGVLETLKRLPDDQRLALVLCDLEGYAAKEAAAIIGRSVAATKSLHYRARRNLTDILNREKEDFDGV
jgi:RNA polymerase sigma-70 factor (ECF subfamily)